MNKIFNEYDSLGLMSPFYITKDHKLCVKQVFSEILCEKESHHSIDPVSIIQILNKSYTFGNRTMIEGIELTPWMSKPNKDYSEWISVDPLPKHGYRIEKEEEVAKNLFEKLKKEVLGYIGSRKNVGILLSGGMDSRIVAAALKILQNEADLNFSVVALTWGFKNSRDVVYAEKIARMFKWEWRHFELSADSLLENMSVASKTGVLYSPIHLHAMPRIAEEKGLDCIIAGSYGDSVGRAEYSGVNVESLDSSGSGMMNKFSIFKSSVYKRYVDIVQQDLEDYYRKFPREKDYQKFELERQIHYMRKQLNQCMSYINYNIPIYQAFSKPDIFGYMWSLSPSVRNDSIYYHILKYFYHYLLEIPWARTGRRYYVDNAIEPDNYLDYYHTYGKWIRNDLYSVISEKVLSSSIENLNIFNMDILKLLVSLNSSSSKIKTTMIDEYLILIAALSDFVKIYKVQGLAREQDSLFSYTQRHVTCLLHYSAYNIKHRNLK